MINLSYPLCNDTPVYGGGKSPVIAAGKSIQKGDSCNTLELFFTNHTGTHIDFPAHFDVSGKKLTDYSSKFWLSKNIQCVFMNKLTKAGRMDACNGFPGGRLIGIAEIEPLINDSSIRNYDVEVVLLKTGFCENRNKEVYWKRPPGIDPELPDFLREQFPNLKFFGMDIISVSSFADREAGRLAHKAFLKHKNPILPIEDMNLCNLPQTLFNILVVPLYIENADGAPCTVFANIGL